MNKRKNRPYRVYCGWTQKRYGNMTPQGSFSGADAAKEKANAMLGSSHFAWGLCFRVMVMDETTSTGSVIADLLQDGD